MASNINNTITFIIFVTPHFILATTTAFLDPFRAANYLIGESRFKWSFVSATGGDIPSSNGMSIATRSIEDAKGDEPDMVVVSSSWSPERYQDETHIKALHRWAKVGVKVGALDTGGFMLAQAGQLRGKRATVHYEHIDAFIELYPNVTVTESLFVRDASVFTCCGGTASVDLALNILRDLTGEGVANAVARYLFHHDVRDPDASQNPALQEPFGQTTPNVVRRAIDLMETHLENPLSIPDIYKELNVSQRHLGRLFKTYVRKTAVLYYRDIRLDRARGLVTQTELKLSEVAVASGFSSQVHFSRAYHERFGLSPKQDRTDGRVPFEFRAWPMYNPERV